MEKTIPQSRGLDGRSMTPERSKNLLADFTHFRHVIGWPDASVYTTEDLAYFDMLEAERLAGRVEIDGEATDWKGHLMREFLECRLYPNWPDLYETHDKEDQEYLMDLEMQYMDGKLTPKAVK